MPRFACASFTRAAGGGTVQGTFYTVKHNGTEGLPGGWSVQYNADSIQVVPEPATVALLNLAAAARVRRNPPLLTRG